MVIKKQKSRVNASKRGEEQNIPSEKSPISKGAEI